MTLLWKFTANDAVIISILLKPASMNIDLFVAVTKYG